MSARLARIWFAVTALCVASGVALSVYTSVQTPGRFHSGVERGFNTFAFFTIQSNLILGATALLLAMKLDRPSTLFRAFRLIGLAAITITGVVYHVALARILDLDGVHQLGNQLVDTIVPLLAIFGWLIFGPRGQTSWRVAWLSALYPFFWLAFTLIRGAIIHWYPYPFIDVTTLGYAKAILNCFWLSLLFLGLAAGATTLDARLRPQSPEPVPADDQSEQRAKRRQELKAQRYARLKANHWRWVRWPIATVIILGVLAANVASLTGAVHLACQITITPAGTILCSVPDITNYAPELAVVLLLLLPWWLVPWDRVSRIGPVEFAAELAAFDLLSKTGPPAGSLTGAELATELAAVDLLSRTGPPAGSLTAAELAASGQQNAGP